MCCLLLTLVNDKFEKDNYLLKVIAKEMDIDIEDILDFDLYVYATERDICGD